MTITSTPAFIGTLDANRTIVLPPEVPAGSTVAVFVVPPTASDEAARHARFAETLAAVRAASQLPQPEISDAKRDALIREARRSAHA